MSANIRISKLISFLLLGLYVLLYIVSSTVADIYYLVHDPVLGVILQPVETGPGLVVDEVIPKGPADLAGLQNGDVVLQINEIAIRGFREQQGAYKTIRPGKPVRVLVERRGARAWVTFVPGIRLKVYTKSFLLGMLPGVLFCYSLCLIGLFVLLNKIHDRTAHIFYLMVLLWALAMWGVFPFGSGALMKLLPSWFSWLRLTYLPIACGILLHFTLIFPEEKRIYRKHPRLFHLIGYGPVSLVALFIYAEIQGADWGASLLNVGWGIWISVIFVTSLSLLRHSAANAKTPRMVEQARIMYRGTMLTLALPTGIYFLPYNFLERPLPYSEYVLLLTVLWPMILAYAIIKHRFMDIDFIVKRGLAYTLTSGFVVAAYFLLVVGIGKLVLLVTGSSSQFVTIIATLIIASLFNPVKNRVQAFVDRRFFPSRFTYRQAVRRLNHKLVNVVDLEKLQDLVEAFLGDTMQVAPIVSYWMDDGRNCFVVQKSRDIDKSDCVPFREDDVVVQKLLKSTQLIDVSALKDTLEQLPAEALHGWTLLQTEIVLPLTTKGKLQGFVSLGPKTNGESYYREDLEVLEALSDQVNVSLANAMLTEELREQERMKKELEVARRIQLSSLPQTDPEVPGLWVSGVSIPALEVGGDYYDYLYFADGSFGVVVGDVSGKGTSAALYMSQLKGILKTASKFHLSLEPLMTEVNSVTFDNIEEQAFITLACGAFDLKFQKFRLVRAGHLPVIHVCCQSGEYQELTPPGIGIGLEAGAIFNSELEECEVAFDSGDVFLFFSDGIVEARNASGEEFDTRQLVKVVKNNGVVDAGTLREKIIASVQSFVGDVSQIDDMTLVVVKIK